MDILKKITGSYTDNNKDRVRRIVEMTNSYKNQFRRITNSSDLVTENIEVVDYDTNTVNKVKVEITKEEQFFRNKTNEFRRRLRNGETIYDIMPEAFALCREATFRKLNMFQYDVQVEAASAMTSKDEYVVAEMKTGEGKTLVQILTAYLNVLESTKSEDMREWGSVHVITSNDYLAQRDCQDNKEVYKLLGLSSGFAFPQSATKSNKSLKSHKRQNYRSDIVYGTANTIAFDYLQDNRVYKKSDQMMSRRMDHAIIDEADDILIDQATVPLILSESVADDLETRELYAKATDYINGVKYRRKPLSITQFNQYGINKYDEHTNECAIFLDNGQIDIVEPVIDEIYNLVKDPSKNDEYNTEIGNRFYLIVEQCIRAKCLYERGTQYEVSETEPKSGINRIYLINQSTGRIMPNNRYKDGIQEAIEAKEALELRKKGSDKFQYSKITKNLGKCTYSSFFELYKNGISGMTGTSDEQEFEDVYSLRTYKVPTRKRNIRLDEPDEVYATVEEKHAAILKEILKCQRTKQPVLIGTLNIGESNKIARMLRENGIRFQLLNAVNASNEDGIKKTAGLLGSVTIATNMAGRGIDIKLGDGVIETGGLCVLSTSQNINERIDNQLKGRASRQGNPGRTKCFMSLSDPSVQTVINISKLTKLVELFKGKGKILNKKIINLVKQSQVISDSKNKSSRISENIKERKVLRDQRLRVYNFRNKVLKSDSIGVIKCLASMIKSYVSSLFERGITYEELVSLFGDKINISKCKSNDKELYQRNICDALINKIKKNMSKKPSQFIEDLRIKMLENIDMCWQNHMDNLEECWDSALMAQYASKDAFKEYETFGKIQFINLDHDIAEITTSMALDPTYTLETFKNSRVTLKNDNLGVVL